MPSLSESLHMTEAEARQQYRELLERNEKPQQGDAELLGRVLDVLDLTVADFRDDVRAVSEATMIEADYQDKEPISERIREAKEQRDEHEQETARIVREREAKQRQLDQTVQAALNELQAQNDREARVKKLTAEHRLAFGLEPKREAPKPPAGVVETVRTEVVPPPVYPEGKEPWPPAPGENNIRPHGEYE